MGLFSKSNFAVPKIIEWSRRKPEFEKEYIGQKTIFPTIAHRILGVKPGQELSIKNKHLIYNTQLYFLCSIDRVRH